MVFAVDNETFLISAGNQAPRMVCLSITDATRSANVLHARNPQCRQTIEALLRSEHLIVGHNVAFDVAVWAQEWPDLLPLIFAAYDADRITDTMLRQQLLDIAHGEYRGRHTPTGLFERYSYDLAAVAARHEYPHKLEKDTWRLRYAELYRYRVADWPLAAVEYAQHDARSTLWVYTRQQAEAPLLLDQYRQARAAFALRLVSAWGIRTDRIMVERQRLAVEAQIASYETRLLEAGFLARDKSGRLHRLANKIQAHAESIAPPHAPRTATLKLQLDADALVHYAHDPILEAYQGYSSSNVLLTRVAELAAGVDRPIHTRFDLVETGRTSSSAPNIQNRSVAVGDRECFVPRKGFVFVDADFDGLELRTIAQACLLLVGQSELAKSLNAGEDPHALIAARLLGVPYQDVLARKEDPNDKAVYLARQSGKIANFGLAGGLGLRTLIKQARAKYGQSLSEAEAAALIAAWHEQWPEMKLYFRHVEQELKLHGEIQQLGSLRWRGNVDYTVGCNTYFQGLGSDCTKAALYALVRECYIGNGVLRGSRVVNYIHDEYIAEVPEDGGHECAEALSKLVTETAGQWLPDLKMSAKPLLARRWSKKAKRQFDQHKRLVPWEWDAATAAGSPGYAT